MTRHDSHVRSDWYPIGTTRGKAEELAEAIERRFADLGEAYTTRLNAHSGRREDGCDFVAPTAPGGWNKQHAGRYTVKIRGCDGFRLQARRFADELVRPEAAVQAADRKLRRELEQITDPRLRAECLKTMEDKR
jgi:hypothetical protein